MSENKLSTIRIFYLLLFSMGGLLLSGVLLWFAERFIPLFESTIWRYRLSILLQDVFVLFLPACIVCRQISNRPMQLLGIEKRKGVFRFLLFGLLLFLVSYPAIAIIAQWNRQIVFPKSMKTVETWMRQLEESALAVTDLFLSGETFVDLFLNMSIIAAAAAFAEEVFFRGFLQRLFEKLMRNGHAAVWTGAFIFSLVHLQFYGFFPRLVMGAILGYLFLYSRNLWIPILYHFVNNASVVLVHFFWGENNCLSRIENESINWISCLILMASALLTVFMFSKYKQQFKER